ncbi:MAG: hypothetical protein HO274_08645 [Ferrovum myxofaciens]|uniref:hypothetical protein n=1 Tax=Ferrovum myxofaciens TaxID=416213 RepID=UPI0023566499|nr:hypothetical protein [Ferrovum myxofaciens]QKE41377.1 MAG: hypothetical protein HO274_08645 [Ferrovum myxofaciens]
MSKLRTPIGDDHPDAALKHLLDAQALLGQSRADGSAYLSGYVVECALKSLWLLEVGVPLDNPMPWTRKNGHNLNELAKTVAGLASIADAKTARYFKTTTRGVLSSALVQWKPEMRYQSPCMSTHDAQAWVNIANDIFLETIAQMQLDGVI